MLRRTFLHLALGAMALSAAPGSSLAAEPAAFTPDQLAQLYRILAAAGWEGLEAGDYLTPRLEAQLTSDNPAERSAGEAGLAEAAARYAHDVRSGKMPVSAFRSDWAMRPGPFDARAELAAAAAAGRLEAWLAELAPQQPGYRRLLPELARYQQIVARGGWQPLDARKPLNLGQVGDGVAALRERLAVEEMAPAAAEDPRLYDAELAAAVAAYQRTRGMSETGTADRTTLLSLNVPAQTRLTAIRASLERWRWAPRDLAASRVEVNVAAAYLQAFEAGVPALAMPTVVGRPADPTPMFADVIESVIFNPPWNVPATIAAREILPKAARDPGYLAREDFIWIEGAGGRRLQQRAGPKSALGRFKFDLPNRFNVYLHDTPNHAVFARSVRTLSHGCIRLHEPRALALWLLGRQGWDAARIDTAVAAGETASARLDRPTPVYLFYFTAFVDESGVLNFRDDVYGWDRLVAAAL